MISKFTLIVATILIASCKGNIENTSSANKTLNTEDTVFKLDTTLLFNVWASDKAAPHADFLLSKDEYLTVDGGYDYSLKENLIEIQFPDSNERFEIKHLSKDTLKVRWQYNDFDTTYLTFDSEN